MTGSPESVSGQPHASAGPDHVWGPPDSEAPATRPRNGLGVASLVVGVVALVASLTVVGGLMLGVLAALLGLLARAQVRHGQASNGDTAMTGVVLGVLAIVASLIFALFWVVPEWIINSETTTMGASLITRETSNLASECRWNSNPVDTIGSPVSSRALVVASQQAPVRGQQLELTTCGDQTFGRVQNVDDMAAIAGHHRHTDTRSAVEVARTGLGG